MVVQQRQGRWGQGSPGRVTVLDRAEVVLDRTVAADGVEGPWHNLFV